MPIRLRLLFTIVSLLQTVAYAQTFEREEFVPKLALSYDVNTPPKAETPTAPVAAPKAAKPAIWKPWIRVDGKTEPDGTIRLQWQTDPKPVKRIFLVERSADGALWEQLTQINSDGIASGKHAYQFLDVQAQQTGYYRVFCFVGDTTKFYSPTVSVVGTLRPSQPYPPIRYYTVQRKSVSIGLETNYLTFPVTANFYSTTGKILCYDTMEKHGDVFVVEMPDAKDPTLKLQVVDGSGRVLTTRAILRPNE
jgi:hypothetical protein